MDENYLFTDETDEKNNQKLKENMQLTSTTTLDSLRTESIKHRKINKLKELLQSTRKLPYKYSKMPQIISENEEENKLDNKIK